MPIEIVFRPTSRRDQFNLIEFEATLTNDGKPVDRVILGSGARGRQELIHPAMDTPGSLRPIPEGVYKIGRVEHNPHGWGQGLGNWWVDLIPVKPANKRSAFGIHLDSNRNGGSPGSAGCPVAATPDRLDRILKWIEAKNRPELFYVDYGKGYLKQIGMLPPSAPQPALTPVPSGNRWSKALAEAKPAGASARTAAQDGLRHGGYQASQQLARTDLSRARSVLPALREASQSTGIPVAILAALASRESRVGNALDSGGWGDRGMAFGILQIDRRYHQIITSGGPKGASHCKQAAEIFKGFLAAVERKHPTWPDWAILQGGCVAYNSGVGNVATIPNMDIGTTGNDYGSDVLARAQFFENEI